MIWHFICYKVEYKKQSEDSACCLDDGTMHQVCECNKPIDWCKEQCTKDAYCKGYVKSSVVTDTNSGEPKGFVYDNWDTINTALCWLVEGACVDYAVSIAKFFGFYGGEPKRNPNKKFDVCQIATPTTCPQGCKRIQTTKGNLGMLSKDKVCGMKKCGNNKKQRCYKGCFIKQF